MAKKLTIDEQFKQHPGPDKCTKTEICKALSMALNFSDSRRGLCCVLFYRLDSAATSRRVVYFGGDFKKGIQLHFCPFCGKRVPERQEPKAGDVVVGEIQAAKVG